MRYRRTALALAALAACASPVRAQIPVTDAILNTTNITSQIATMLKWVEQARQMEAQITRFDRDWRAANGSRRLGMVLNDPRLRDYLPDEWRELYRLARQQGVLSLSGTGQEVYNRNKLVDVCEHHVDDVQRLTCEARSVKDAIDAGLALDSLEDADRRIGQIEDLMRQIDNSNNDDPRSISELQGRLAAEQANIQNEQIKLDLFEMVASAEGKLLEQRDLQVQYRAISAPDSIQATPLTFR